eukprot:1137339-Pelagomonas_calceolata.AAC.1
MSARNWQWYRHKVILDAQAKWARAASCASLYHTLQQGLGGESAQYIGSVLPPSILGVCLKGMLCEKSAGCLLSAQRMGFSLI